MRHWNKFTEGPEDHEPDADDEFHEPRPVDSRERLVLHVPASATESSPAARFVKWMRPPIFARNTFELNIEPRAPSDLTSWLTIFPPADELTLRDCSWAPRGGMFEGNDYGQQKSEALRVLNGPAGKLIRSMRWLRCRWPMDIWNVPPSLTDAIMLCAAPGGVTSP